MEPYQYKPLQADEIRLITLPPAVSGNTTISIQSVELLQDDPPRYEALSYTWGSTKDLVQIDVQEPSDAAASNSYQLDVTFNLAQALPYLQSKDQLRILWIDAISINQQDLAEKSRQVKKMGSIYKSAASVIVWLGPSTEQLVTGLNAINQLASRIDVNFEAGQMWPASSQDPSWADTDVELPYDDKTVAAISRVLDCNWFERLWIWQEIHAQPKRSSLLCGSTHLNWEVFCRAIYCLERRMVAGADSGRDFPRGKLAAIARLCRPQNLSKFNLLLSDTEYAKFSDPRDRIYSLLSLRHPWQQQNIPIEPDYTASIGDVYRDATAAYVKGTGKLDLLEACELHDCPGMPSWVRDWSFPGRRELLTGTHASLYSKAEAVFAGNSILEVAGVEVTNIEKVDSSNGVFSTKQATWEDFFQELVKLLPNDSNDTELVLRTLACGRFSDVWIPYEATSINIEDLTSSFRHRRLHADSDRPVDSASSQGVRKPTISERRFKACVDSFTVGRALITISDGQIGLGPGDARAGDMVCALLGSSNLLVLRPLSDNLWQVVGLCYVERFMSGEAFYGPLPEDLRVVRQSTRTGVFPMFLDQKSDKMTPRDPRGLLPPGWEFHEDCGQDSFEIYHNIETSEVTGFDPRLTSKQLLNRGVPMRTFKLV